MEICDINIPSIIDKIDISDKIDDNICVICIDNIDITDSDTTQIDCNHIFHKDCIDKWLNINKKCPVCIRNIVDYKSTIVKNDNVIEIQNTQNNIQNNRFNKSISICLCILFIPLIIISITNLLYLPITFDFINMNYVEV